MPVSGLVVTLSNQRTPREDALQRIGRESRIETGAISGNQIAIVMDTKDSVEDKELWNWLGELPGVEFVDVAMVGFEDRNTNGC